jgi:hypothetical protein
MATVNLGAIKFNWKGAYAGGTAYVADDVVSYLGSSYVCILASTGNVPTNGTYWNQMSSAGTNGTNGTDVGTTITTQGDILYRNASGLARLGYGTAGQYLETKGASANPVWSTVSTGAFSIKEITNTAFTLNTHAGNSNTAYNFGTPIQITPTASTDRIDIRLQTTVEGTLGCYYGMAIGVNTSDTWGTATNDSRLKQSTGEFAFGMGIGDDTERYQTLFLGGVYTLADMGMTAGTLYYVSPFILVHSQAGQIKTGERTTNYAGDPNRMDIIRYGV